MKIEKCKIDVKCDVDGCHGKAEYQFVFDGVTAQYRFCQGCVTKIKNALKGMDGGSKSEAR